MEPKVSIIMGSTSDMKVMDQAAKFLEEMEIPFEINALSAHRVPDMVHEFAHNAHKRGIRVIIAGAGGAADQRGDLHAGFSAEGADVLDVFFGLQLQGDRQLAGGDVVLDAPQEVFAHSFAVTHGNAGFHD